MALGNDLDSKITLIYQEYLKKQQDEKIADRVYTSEEAFRNGLEEVIKVNGIVDKNEFYTAIAFEIQNGNFSISNDGKIDMTTESINKAVERAKEKENKSKGVINKETQQNNSDSEKGILGITQIKTLEDAKKVLSARIRTEDMTPERRKLSEDALTMSLSQVMDEEEARNTSAEVVEFVFERNIPERAKSAGMESFDFGKRAFSKIIEKTVGEEAQGLLHINYGDFLKHIESKYGSIRAESVRKSFEEFDIRYLQDYSKFEPLLAFTTFHDGKTLSFIDDVIRSVNILQESNLLSESSVATEIKKVFDSMELAGVTITPDMIENAQMIVKDPSIVLELATRQKDRTQMQEQMINDNGDLLVEFIQTQKGESLREIYDLADQTLSEVTGNSFKRNDSSLQDAINLVGTGKKSIGEIYRSAEVIFDNSFKNDEIILEPVKKVEIESPEIVDFTEVDAGLDADLMFIGDAGDDMFAAMFGDMAEEMVVGGSEVEKTPEVELELEPEEEIILDAPPVVNNASGIIAEDMTVGETSQEFESPEESKSEQNAMVVDTTANKIKRSLIEFGKTIGKAVKGVFGKIANAFNGGNNSESNNTGSNGGGVTQEPKDSQIHTDVNFIPQATLNFDFLKAGNEDKKMDPTQARDGKGEDTEIVD